MTDYTLGSTYRKGFINTSEEIIPKAPIFNSHKGEELVFEERPHSVSFYQITTAIEKGIITKLDKTVLSLISVFSSAACTTKPIFEMLTLMGIETTREELESCIRRLHRYHLINLSRFRQPNGTLSYTRVITLMKYGSQLAKSLGVIHRFNAIAAASAEPYAIKSRAEAAQLICNWLKNLPVDSFSVRPVIVVDPEEGAIIRPAASIDIWDETIYFEVPRRREDWLCDLTQKFKRYELVFGKDKLPTVVINGEDKMMNLEIHKALKKECFGAEILFTDDLAMFGSAFSTCLYSFDSEDKLIRYSINNKEREAV